jgi:hypothetical protein
MGKSVAYLRTWKLPGVAKGREGGGRGHGKKLEEPDPGLHESNKKPLEVFSRSGNDVK